MRCVIVLLALVALSYALPLSCNTTYVCQKENQQCGLNYGPDVASQCASGTQCDVNICKRRPTKGESCTGPLACYDPDYDITCDGTVCRYVNIYAAGDGCKPNDSLFKNGGCVSGLTCDIATSKCTGLTVGTDCSSGNSDRNCNVGLFCNGNGNVCAQRLTAGQVCTDHYECDPELICSNEPGNNAQRTCKAPFSGAAGASCNDNFDCAKDLGCDKDVCTSAPTTEGESCETDTDICSDFADCECQLEGVNSTAIRELGVAKCVNQPGIDEKYNTGSNVDAFLSMQRCLKSKGCHDFWDSLEIRLDSGPDQCIRSCLKSGFITGYEKQGNGYNECGSSVIFPSLVVLLAVVVAMFF